MKADICIDTILGQMSWHYTINSTQKRVDPQLQLRVIYSNEEGIRKLIDEIKEVIPWQSWKLKALKIAMKLENDGNSPWHTLIKLPNEEKIPGSWKLLNEGTFIDSLRFVSSDGNPLEYLEDDLKIKYMIAYWNAIKKLYPDSFDKEKANRYILTTTSGVGILNALFPIATTLSIILRKDFGEVLKPLQKKFPLSEWRKKSGKLSKRGSGQEVYKSTATELLIKIKSQLDYFDDKSHERLLENGRQLGILKKAANMLSPLYLRSSAYLENYKGKFRKACYVLADFNEDKIGVYVGQTKNVENRLRNHKRKYNLYFVKSCADEKEMDFLEGALYHLVDEKVRENGVHPNKKYCAFCNVLA